MQPQRNRGVFWASPAILKRSRSPTFTALKGTLSGSSAETGLKESAEIKEGENQVSCHRAVHKCTFGEMRGLRTLQLFRPDRSKVVFQVRYAKLIAACCHRILGLPAAIRWHHPRTLYGAHEFSWGGLGDRVAENAQPCAIAEHQNERPAAAA